MKAQKIESDRSALQAERVTLHRVLAFCADPDTRSGLQRRLAAADASLVQFDGIVRLARPRVDALRDRNLRRLGIATAARR